jgi:hypothetical protein
MRLPINQKIMEVKIKANEAEKQRLELVPPCV